MADTYRTMAIAAHAPAQEVCPQAKAFARSALELDESVADAHIVLGWIGFLFDLDWENSEKELKRVEAIIHSMTIQERRNPALLNGSRRKRIANGSGTTVTDINRLMKQFLEMKKMMQRVSKGGVRSLLSQMPNPFH